MSSRDEIAELLSNYAWAMDAGEFEPLNDVFTEDAKFAIEIPGADPIGPIEPRDAIVEFIAGSVTGMNDQRRHVVTNQRFAREGEDDADVTSTLTLISIADGELTVVSTGVYESVVVRDGGAWRIASLKILLDRPF